MSTFIKNKNLTTLVEKIIIDLIEENRYSFQLTRSTKVISSRINVDIKKLDASTDSLCLIDNYLNYSSSNKNIDLEFYLSITIYFSQVLISSCNGIWSMDDTVYSSKENYSLSLLLYGTNIYSSPHCTIAGSLDRENKSNLKRAIDDNISSVKKYYLEKNRQNLYCPNYPLSGLDLLLAEGHNFYSEIANLILKLSSISNIPIKKLNRSISSLTLIDNFIRTNGQNLLWNTTNFDKDNFLALITYIGEIIIKNVNGRWSVSSEKINLAGNIEYHWTIKIFNSRNQFLKNFIDDLCDNLEEHTYKQSRIKRLIEDYIHEDRMQDKSTWCDYISPKWQFY
jgi:hypothetical protein